MSLLEQLLLLMIYSWNLIERILEGLVKPPIETSEKIKLLTKTDNLFNPFIILYTYSIQF